MDRNIDSLELSIRRQKRFDKQSLVKIEMEASRETKGGDKILKKWLSELRGKEMSESFAWSYKRKYKISYIWQDLTDNDLIIPSSYYEYVLKGSLLSPIKRFERLKEEAKSFATPATLRTTGVTLQREKIASPKPPIELVEQSPEETSNSSSEEDQRKTAIFKIDYWKEKMKRAEKVSCEKIVPLENGRQLTKGDERSILNGNNGGKRLGQVEEAIYLSNSRSLYLTLVLRTIPMGSNERSIKTFSSTVSSLKSEYGLSQF
ncbi:hypothetical protein KFK09_019403 [Dendrobium nobile]|uniref:SOSEKI DIX-like domain-containing protein n=1 Tax=Dendrobium nobile TaxID=94219 RepID=A0A8T3AWL9_DENNO|nr:hypothetical protein KFK09_019403 [Dendrobium nobile]